MGKKMFLKEDAEVKIDNENSLETNFLKFYDWKIDLYQLIKNTEVLNEMFYDSFDQIKNGRRYSYY